MPTIPRIQRLSCYKQLATLHGWHDSHRSESGVMGILAYSITLKHIENTWPDKFKDEVYILLLSIAKDGVNLYSL